MPNKVYCEDCEFLVNIPTICGMTNEEYKCSHKYNVKYEDIWLRKNPKEKVFSCSPMTKNMNNDCRDFKAKKTIVY